MHGQEKTEIERPQQKHAIDSAEQEKEQDSRHSHPPSLIPQHYDSERKSIISSIKTQLSKVFHLDGDDSPPNGNVLSHEENRNQRDDDTDHSASSIGSPLPSRPPTPMLDPSTNTNPMREGDPDEDGENKDHEGIKTKKAKQTAKKVSGDVSKHTFYIVNSQMRLKLFARNEVG